MGGTDPQIVILVVRSGGIAGVRRRWQVEAPSGEADAWIALIDECPWDAAVPEPRGADRFRWSIRVRTGADPDTDEREQELPDSALDGPWRELVDAVRAAASPAA